LARGWHRVWPAWWLLLGLTACATSNEDEPEAGDSISVATQAIIYGQDDRVEVYEAPDARLRALASSSFVALVPRSHFARTSSGDFAIFTRPLKDAFQVCEDARFAKQPTAADCSGVLIDDDLVLTAGHCFTSDDACERFAFMFDYFFSGPGDLEPMGWGDVYGCRRIVKRQVTIDASTPRIDFAVVQLDRTAIGRTPVSFRTTPLADGEPLSVLGCVSGLPAKIDSGAHVVSSRAPNGDFFLLDSDTFQGSSGSGVFDANAQLVGVLVRGGEDYVERPDASCKVPKVITPAGDSGTLRVGLGEEATYVARVVEGLCASGWPSQRLCGAQPRCGDGFCSAGENRVACAVDCDCADGPCSVPGQETAASAGAPALKSKSSGHDSGCSVVAPGRSAPWFWHGGLLWMLALGSVCWRAVRRRP
jgi:Trypsin-like peptidase domain